MTQEMVDKLEAASEHGLYEAHTKDNYIYLVDRNGNPVNNFKGVAGDKNLNVSAPYLVCDYHTQEQWELYMQHINNPNQPETPNQPELPSEAELPVE